MFAGSTQGGQQRTVHVLRFKYNSKGQANEEQDLQGFDTMVVKPKDKLMGTIQEGPDETSPDSHGKRPSGGGGIMPYSNGAMRCVPGARGSDERGDRRSLKFTKWQQKGTGTSRQMSIGCHHSMCHPASHAGCGALQSPLRSAFTSVHTTAHHGAHHLAINGMHVDVDTS